MAVLQIPKRLAEDPSNPYAICDEETGERVALIPCRASGGQLDMRAIEFRTKLIITYNASEEVLAQEFEEERLRTQNRIG